MKSLLGPEWFGDKLNLLADLDYCRFACHGDKLAARLLHYVYQCRSDVSQSFHGYGYVGRARAKMATGAGMTIRQFAKHAWPRLRCYPYIAAETWPEAHGSIRRAVWFALFPLRLPDPPAGAVDWRALKQAAPWLHLKLKPSLKKAHALPVPASPIASEPVAAVLAPSTAKPLPVAATKPKHKAAPSWATVGLKSGAFLPVNATILWDGSPHSPQPGDDAAPRKRTLSAEAAQRRSARIRLAWQAKDALDNLGKGVSLLDVAHLIRELSALLRQPVPYGDVWLLNEWTYEDDAANEKWVSKTMLRSKYDAPQYWYERGFERRPGEKYVKLPKVKIPTLATSKYAPQPSRDALLRRLREAAIKAGYRDKFLAFKNGNNLVV